MVYVLRKGRRVPRTTFVFTLFGFEAYLKIKTCQFGKGRVTTKLFGYSLVVLGVQCAKRIP